MHSITDTTTAELLVLLVTSTSNLPVRTIRFPLLSLAQRYGHDSRTTMNVYSARPRLVALVLYTVTDNRDGDTAHRIGRPIPAVR